VDLDSVHERERVYATYAPLRRRDLLTWVIGFVGLLAASRFVTVDWFFYAGLIASLVGWEITKLRLRKNADRFARHE
jgi:hypothetical protein